MSATFQTSIDIAAPPTKVFGYFTDPAAIVTWIGNHAVLDPQPGGEFSLDIEGIPIRGRYVEVDEPNRIVVSWGHAGSTIIPAGSTEVVFTFEAVEFGTRVLVEHRKLPITEVESHRAGWPMFLQRLRDVA